MLLDHNGQPINEVKKIITRSQKIYEADFALNLPQYEFISLLKPFKAFVGGFRSGKTVVGCYNLCSNAYSFPGIKQGYFAPTYTHIRDIFYPTIEELGAKLGLRVKIAYSIKEVRLLCGKALHSIIKCRSMDNPGSIVGFEIGHGLVDEIDILKLKHAEHAWRKIIARMSAKYRTRPVNTLDVTTTPEGYNFVYDLFVRQVNADLEMQKFYGIVHASTLKNRQNLPDDYIPKLYVTYPSQLVDAYIQGLFVNLTTGSVYNAFDRVRCRSKETIQQGEPLFIGQDFNVGNMCSVVHVKRMAEVDAVTNQGIIYKEKKQVPHAVDEIKGILDTPALIRELKKLYPKHTINIFPDASGENRSTNNASESDISLLRNHFNVFNHASNPYVKDRVLAMNTAFDKGKYFVNDELCPDYTACLEQQTYNENGEPDKKKGFDHLPDAGGYFINHEFPILGRGSISSLRI